MSFWDSDTGEAHKIKGKAVYHSKGSVYEKGRKFMQSERKGSTPRGGG